MMKRMNWKEETKNRALTREDLKTVSGGYWDDDTLTDEEWDRLDTLYEAWFNAPTHSKEEVLADLDARAFIEDMEKKYGPWGYSADDMLNYARKKD